MSELRYDPLRGEYVMIAGNRQQRPVAGDGGCPFCPGGGRISHDYDTLRYPNDFPAMTVNPRDPAAVAEPYVNAPAYGICEVLLYTSQHDTAMWQLSDEHMIKVAHMWRECFVSMSSDERIKYVFIFENRGRQVGVTMDHPHGQAYGYSVVPKRMADEAANAAVYRTKTGGCIFCDILDRERQDGVRMIGEDGDFSLFVPYFSRTAYGTYLMADRHVKNIADFADDELRSLGIWVRDICGMYDELFSAPMPYMMCMHNAPMGAEDGHFYIEFIPVLRSADRQQFFAASETGAGAWCNPTVPEEKAVELKAAYERFVVRNSK